MSNNDPGKGPRDTEANLVDVHFNDTWSEDPALGLDVTVEPKRVSRKSLLKGLGMREFRLAPGGERVAVVRNNVVGVAERPKPEGEDFSGADIIVKNGDTIARLSLLETYPTVIEVLGK